MDGSVQPGMPGGRAADRGQRALRTVYLKEEDETHYSYGEEYYKCQDGVKCIIRGIKGQFFRGLFFFIRGTRGTRLRGSGRPGSGRGRGGCGGSGCGGSGCPGSGLGWFLGFLVRLFRWWGHDLSIQTEKDPECPENRTAPLRPGWIPETLPQRSKANCSQRQKPRKALIGCPQREVWLLPATGQSPWLLAGILPAFIWIGCLVEVGIFLILQEGVRGKADPARKERHAEITKQGRQMHGISN